jgi:hypothetical protein
MLKPSKGHVLDVTLVAILFFITDIRMPMKDGSVVRRIRCAHGYKQNPNTKSVAREVFWTPPDNAAIRQFLTVGNLF